METVTNATIELETLVVASTQAIAPIMSEQEAKIFIYFKESSNNLAAENSGGCKGLGQDCNGVLEIECPNWRTDRDCQDVFWDKYAIRRYGSWANAMNHWLSRVPINGRDCGNWW